MKQTIISTNKSINPLDKGSQVNIRDGKKKKEICRIESVSVFLLFCGICMYMFMHCQ